MQAFFMGVKIVCSKYFFFSIISSEFCPDKSGGMGEKSPNSVQKAPLFGADMYGRNSRVTHPTEYSLPAKLAAGDMEKFG